MLKVTREGEKLGINNILGDLRGLSYKALKVFLILCGESARFYTHNDNSITTEFKRKIYDELRSRGLIEYTETRIPADNGIEFHFRTTSKGGSDTSAIIDSLYSELSK